MKEHRITRINELAKKAREQGLTEEEKTEQQALRQQYINAMKASLSATLDHMVIVDEHGNKKRVQRKKD